MRAHVSSFTLMVAGIFALLIGFSTVPSPRGVAAQAPEPSPRPALVPTSSVSQDDTRPTEVVPGRVTGTVIDLRTGAPVAGIAVVVGNQTIYSDANGNYDIWLTSGYYQLDLALSATQGSAGQSAQAIAVGPGDTVLVHLFFTSPAPTATVTPVVLPTPTIAPILTALPDTSVAHEKVPVPHTTVSALPQNLPHTAAAAGFGSAGTWILLGALLLGLSLVIQLAPRRRPRLTTRRVRGRDRSMPTPENVEDLLNKLLDRDL
ncbi:MAG: carboxypeptidase-like regulatory domain-containing protein [Oscillochloris sp.]|nr:carboxypeptidase-like regulatory domain-containing protein [Oscillochloris sp.]